MNQRRVHWSGSRPLGMAITTLLVGVTVAACSSSGGGTATGKGDASPDFSGKTITMVAPFAAGGSADVLARLTAHELGKFLPGKPTVVVKNLEGGGGSVGLDYVANKQPADGLTLGFFGGGMAIRYVSKTTGFSDLPKQPLIGGFPQGLVQPTIAKFGTDIQKLQQLKSPMKIAESSAGGTGALTATVASKLLNIPMKQVFGFSGGGSDAATSMLRGETDAAETADTSYDKTYLPYVKQGKFEALFQSGIMNDKDQIVASPLVPDVPTILDLYKQANNGAEPTGEPWKAYQILANLNTSNYVMAAREGTPDKVLNTLRRAFDQMSASSGWKTFTSSSLSVPLATTSSEAATKAWLGFLNSSPEDVAIFSKYAGVKKGD